jgi:peptide/nickel transport system permease protein
MFRYIARRLIFSIPVLLIASIGVFYIVRATTSPLGALAGNTRITAEDVQRYKENLGLDKSGFQQYTTWLSHFVRGNWGSSLINHRPVWPDIREALVNTLVLGLTATVFSLLIGITIGVISAVRQYSLFDYFSTGGAFFGLSMPPFWFGLILQIVFGLYFVSWFHAGGPLLPTAGMTAPGSQGFDLLDRARHLVLPTITLSVQIIAVYSRYLRSSMLEVLGSDYLRTARAKGLPERTVVIKHGMRNALIPLTTQVAIDIGALAGGLVVTESIFQWPGMGSLFIQAINLGDYAVVLPWVTLVVVFVIVLNLVADISYGVLDPRIRYA